VEPFQEPTRPRVRILAKTALALSFVFLLFSVAGNIAFHINGDMPPSIKGLHPDTGKFADFSYTVILFGTFFFIVFSFISLVLAFFREPRKANFIVSLLAILCASAAPFIIQLAMNRVNNSAGTFHSIRIGQLAEALQEYSQNHQGQLPEATDWCNSISESVVKRWSSGRTSWIMKWYPDRGSAYALNKNIAGAKLKSIPSNVVFLFETSVAKNPAGGPELMNTNNYPVKGCLVLFADMNVAFVRAEDFNNLRWTP
jgi:hypothetical protein